MGAFTTTNMGCGASSEEMWVDAMLKQEDVDADALWKAYDTDESGNIEKDEAKQVAKDISAAMLKAFEKGIDEAWDKMSSDEKKMMEAMKPMIEQASKEMNSDDGITAMFEEMDKNHDGKISKDEFKKFCKGAGKQMQAGPGDCPMQ